MKQNELEIANQDEEISYKDMWLTLKKDLANLIKDNELDAAFHTKCHKFSMGCLAKAYGFDKVLEIMSDIEEENGK